ncbi:MAG TPA: FAD-dependent oxidoreductase [Streptosporangiaceae bacterium]|nr:FAD-dependent oxidoreductase [Streptosporangiaceae bacterium]
MLGDGGPRPASCVVIGAGVIGSCLAVRLAGAGVQVTLLDQAGPGQAATRWSFAWLNSSDKAPRGYHELNHAGMRAWAALAGELGGAAWYRPAGNLEWAATAAGHDQLTARVDRLASWGYPARMIGAAGAAALEPALRWPAAPAGVAWFPAEGYLLTGPLISQLTAAAAERGVTVRTGPAGQVTGFAAGRGTVRAVRTAAGPQIPADTVVCCAGRWSPALAALAGAAGPVPLVPWEPPRAQAPGLVVQAGPAGPGGPARVVHAPGVYLRPHAGGLVHLEAPDAAVDLHTPGAELRRWADELLRRARQVTGGLDGAQVAAYQVCVRPMPADGQPMVGWLPGPRNVYLAVTHSGVTLGAYLAQLITGELVTGTAPAELHPYRPDRFLT